MFTVSIETGNAAFDETPGLGATRSREIARILRELADNVERHDYGTGAQVDWLRDINGNRVGTWKNAPDHKPDHK